MIVEDGSIVPGANALAALQWVDDYHAARGASTWAESPLEAREASIVRATDFVCGYYRKIWKGRKVNADQPLCWPRSGVIDEDGNTFSSTGIPTAVQQAVAVAALDGLQRDLSASQSQRVVKSAQVGPISISYADEALSATVTTTLDQILADLIGLNTNQVRMSVSMF